MQDQPQNQVSNPLSKIPSVEERLEDLEKYAKGLSETLILIQTQFGAMLNGFSKALGINVTVNEDGTVSYQIISPIRQPNGQMGGGALANLYWDVVHLKNTIKGNPILYNAKGERVVNKG